MGTVVGFHRAAVDVVFPVLTVFSGWTCFTGAAFFSMGSIKRTSECVEQQQLPSACPLRTEEIIAIVYPDSRFFSVRAIGAAWLFSRRITQP